MVRHNVNDNDKHNWLFVMDSWSIGTDESFQDTVEVCRDCGRFRVYGRRNTQRFEVVFELPTIELVEAAGQYVKTLSRTEAAQE